MGWGKVNSGDNIAVLVGSIKVQQQKTKFVFQIYIPNFTFQITCNLSFLTSIIIKQFRIFAGSPKPTTLKIYVMYC